MQAQVLQSTYDRGVIQDVPRHMLPPGSVWSMVDFIPDTDGAPIQKRGGWTAGDALSGATTIDAVAYTPFAGDDAYSIIDDRGHIWLSALGYAKSLLISSPSLYWRLGEISGTVAEDSSGHSRDGTYSSITLGELGTVGDSDKSVLFSGASSIITSGYDPFAASSKRTFMGWAKRVAATDADTLIGQYSATNLPLGFSLQLGSGANANNVYIGTGSSTLLNWTGAWPGTGVWAFWALTYDDSTKVAELFINGVSKGTKTLDAGYNSPSGGTLVLGARHVTDGVGAHIVADPWNGYMDEFAVFESILSSATISSLYAAASASGWTDQGAAAITNQRPVFFDSKLIVLPDGTTFTTPKKFDGATISTLALTGLTGVTPEWGVTYKSRLVIADDTTLYFSNVLDPENYDVDSFVKATYPVTGLAALSNMIAIFSSGHCERLRGTTPPSTTSDGDMTLEPAFAEGCIDARSIVTYQDQMIWANLNGVHISDGAGITNLVEAGGIRQYWHSLMESYSSGWVFAGGIFKNRYVLSITDATGAFVAGFLCDLRSKSWAFLNNLPVKMFSESGGATAELVMALSTHNYIGFFSPCFDPSSGDSDGDGTAVEPSIELPFFRNGTGSSRWRDLFLGVDLDNVSGETGELEVYYTETPDSTSYTQLVDDAGAAVTIAGTTGYERTKLPFNLAANGIGLKIVQVGASSKTALFDLEAVTRIREGRY